MPPSGSTTIPSIRRSSPQIRSTRAASCTPSTQIRLARATWARTPATATEPDAVRPGRRRRDRRRSRPDQRHQLALQQEAGRQHRELPPPVEPILQGDGVALLAGHHRPADRDHRAAVRRRPSRPPAPARRAPAGQPCGIGRERAASTSSEYTPSSLGDGPARQPGTHAGPDPLGTVSSCAERTTLRPARRLGLCLAGRFGGLRRRARRGHRPGRHVGGPGFGPGAEPGRHGARRVEAGRHVRS